MKNIVNKHARQAGISYLELSFILIVFGLVASLIAHVVPAMRRASASAETVRNLTNVEFSLLSFASINGRLPCADTSGDGLEVGTGTSCAVIGKLPYVTLGYSGPLVNAEGYDFKYALYNNPGSGLRDQALLGTNTERYRPSIGVSTPPVTLTDTAYTLSNRRLDFCQGLRAGMNLPFNDKYLYVTTQSGNSTPVAYVLVDPGMGSRDLTSNLFDGLNGSASATHPQFEHPNRQRSMGYDDRVVVAYFDQMWTALGCSANMAAAGRAHPNVETTLALIKQSMVDYRTQLSIAVDMAFANNFSAGAATAGSTSALATAGAAVATGIATAINTAGATAGAPASASIAVVKAAANLVVAAVNQGLTAGNYEKFKKFRDDFDTLVSTKLNPLYDSVQVDVQRSGSLVYSDQ